MPSDSYKEFSVLLGTVDQLVDIHRKVQQGRGRRHRQDAIHRSGVVLTVAAWQAYIEKVLGEGLARLESVVIEPANEIAPPPWAVIGIQFQIATVKKSVAKFNTPNAENVKRLFEETFDFDPWPYWTWRLARRNWDGETVRMRTNDWLKIRHSIAHGVDLPNQVSWIIGANGTPRLTLQLLVECKKHFQHLVSETDAAFWAHLERRFDIPALD